MKSQKFPTAVLAVVVTHKRSELLEQCLLALTNQTEKCDILIVNNSPDDKATLKVINSFVTRYDSIFFHNMKSNTGGAGGFRKGMQEAFKEEYEYSWLLDDDALPDSNCLERLKIAAKQQSLDSKGRRIAFYCSLVLTNSGKLCETNLPLLSKSPMSHLSDGKLQLEVQQCSFVSVLFPRFTVAQAGFPVKQMFIGGDDLEYTRRVSRFIGFGFICLDSVVRHSESAILPTYRQPIKNSNLSRKKREFENYFSTLLAHGEYLTFIRNLCAFFVKIFMAPEERRYFGIFLKALAALPARYADIKCELKKVDSGSGNS